MFEQLTSDYPVLSELIGFLVLILVVLIANFVIKKYLIVVAHMMAEKSKATWDDALVEYKVFGRLSQLIPALIVYLSIHYVPYIPDNFEPLVLSVIMAYMMLMATLTLTALLSAFNLMYEMKGLSQQRPIKGFIQLLQIVVVIIAVVLIISHLMGRSPGLLLSGVGAMTAVLLLVFKDTINSLVASVQLSAQDMVRVGDWIEMPQFGADGDVVDVELHLIRVQNWDKTISTIPTHKLISDSFKNWRGMSDSGGRRIKRSVFIDVSSIRFLTTDEITRLKQVKMLKGYLAEKKHDIEAYNKLLLDEGLTDAVNLRQMTNVGTFRAYILNYLQHHPAIRKDMTLMVRQLSPQPTGLPIELYCFTDTTVWSAYEDIQGDIFDHIIAIMPEFGLRLFQNPAGHDVMLLKDGVPFNQQSNNIFTGTQSD